MKVYILWDKWDDKYTPINIATEYDYLYLKARMENRVPLITEEDVFSPEPGVE